MPLPAHALEELRSIVSGVESRAGDEVRPFDLPVIDGRLAAGGLALPALHDAAARSSSLADVAAATLFVAGTAGRLAAGRGVVAWIVTRFDLYGPGLEQAGLAGEDVLFAQARDDTEALALAEDALADGSAGAVVAEVGVVPSIATRRLQLAAERSGTPVLLLRRWRKRDMCPLAAHSVAVTRWRIGTAPSVPLTVPGLGRATWTVELVRQRGGESFSLTLEACDGTGRLALSAAAADRAPASDRAAAARAA